MTNNDDHPFEYQLIGNGKQSIVFLNGFRINFKSWDKVYPAIASDYRVLFFNRHGVGSSTKARIKQSGKVVVADVQEFLSKINLNPPYLLVAHSLGGVFANLFARTYPDIVSGVVFVDAPHPSEIAEQRNFKPPVIVQAINNGIKKIEMAFDEYKYSEDEAIEETISQIQNAGSFPNVPVAVVSGTKKMPLMPQDAFDIHLRYQAKLLDLSTNSKQYLCKESGHFPQLTEAEIVVQAIIETASETRSS